LGTKGLGHEKSRYHINKCSETAEWPGRQPMLSRHCPFRCQQDGTPARRPMPDGARAVPLSVQSSFRVPGLFVPKTFRSQERIVPMGNFRSRDFSLPGTFVPCERKFSGTFVPGPFRSPELSKVPGNFRSLDLSSQELSFLRLFYKALAMNADSYNNCQHLFCSRPSSVCFPKIN